MVKYECDNRSSVNSFLKQGRFIALAYPPLSLFLHSILRYCIFICLSTSISYYIRMAFAIYCLPGGLDCNLSLTSSSTYARCTMIGNVWTASETTRTTHGLPCCKYASMLATANPSIGSNHSSPKPSCIISWWISRSTKHHDEPSQQQAMIY